jgi:hypothetical protein
VDEATGVPRAVDTDDEGRYEASNLRPGTYRVEVSTPSFKKAEQKGIVLRASDVARADITLEIGALSETVTVSAEGADITLESQAVASGLDEQQIHDLPRATRDIQSFLYLNPNVVGGSEGDPQFLGGRTYGVSYVQDGQASTNAIFGTVGNSAPGLDAISEMRVLSNSYSAEYGGLAGVVVTTKRGGNEFHGTSFYDFNADGMNALTYNQKLAGVERGDPNSDTHEHRWGVGVGGPLKSGKTFFYANYEGSNDKAIFGGGRATVPSAAMRNGDFSGASFVIKDPLTGEPFPGNVIPADRIDPAARNINDFFYPLPNQGLLASGFGVFQQFVPETRQRHRADLRIDHELTKDDSLFLRGSYQHRSPNAIQFEGGNLYEPGDPEHQPRHRHRDRRLDEDVLVHRRQRVPRGLQLRQDLPAEQLQRPRRQRHAGDREPAQHRTGPRGLLPLRVHGGSSTSRPINITDGGFNADRTIKQNSFSISDNLSWIVGRTP